MRSLASRTRIAGILRCESERSPPCERPDRSVLAGAEPGPATSSMSAELSREFVDANILVYAFDPSAGTKRIAAERLLERLWETGTGCLSVHGDSGRCRIGM